MGEVTVPRVVIFRDAIVDLLQVEMGARFTKKARDGFATFLNYVGGAYIYVRIKFTDRIKILGSSWATANNKKEDEFAIEEGQGEGEQAGNTEEKASGDIEEQVQQAAQGEEEEK